MMEVREPIVILAGCDFGVENPSRKKSGVILEAYGDGIFFAPVINGRLIFPRLYK